MPFLTQVFCDLIIDSHKRNFRWKNLYARFVKFSKSQIQFWPTLRRQKRSGYPLFNPVYFDSETSSQWSRVHLVPTRCSPRRQSTSLLLGLKSCQSWSIQTANRTVQSVSPLLSNLDYIFTSLNSSNLVMLIFFTPANHLRQLLALSLLPLHCLCKPLLTLTLMSKLFKTFWCTLSPHPLWAS